MRLYYQIYHYILLYEVYIRSLVKDILYCTSFKVTTYTFTYTIFNHFCNKIVSVQRNIHISYTFYAGYHQKGDILEGIFCLFVEKVMHVLDPSHGVGRLITYTVLVVISGQIGFSLEIALKVNLVRCPKFDIYQVTRASIVPIYTLFIGLQGHFCKIILASFHSSLKIRKSHGSTGF